MNSISFVVGIKQKFKLPLNKFKTSRTLLEFLLGTNIQIKKHIVRFYRIKKKLKWVFVITCNKIVIMPDTKLPRQYDLVIRYIHVNDLSKAILETLQTKTLMRIDIVNIINLLYQITEELPEKKSEKIIAPILKVLQPIIIETTPELLENHQAPVDQTAAPLVIVQQLFLTTEPIVDEILQVDETPILVQAESETILDEEITDWANMLELNRLSPLEEPSLIDEILETCIVPREQMPLEIANDLSITSDLQLNDTDSPNDKIELTSVIENLHKMDEEESIKIVFENTESQLSIDLPSFTTTEPVEPSIIIKPKPKVLEMDKITSKKVKPDFEIKKSKQIIKPTPKIISSTTSINSTKSIKHDDTTIVKTTPDLDEENIPKIVTKTSLTQDRYELANNTFTSQKTEKTSVTQVVDDFELKITNSPVLDNLMSNNGVINTYNQTPLVSIVPVELNSSINPVETGNIENKQQLPELEKSAESDELKEEMASSLLNFAIKAFDEIVWSKDIIVEDPDISVMDEIQNSALPIVIETSVIDGIPYTYVTEIAGFKNEGDYNWMMKVDGMTPMMSASEVKLFGKKTIVFEYINTKDLPMAKEDTNGQSFTTDEQPEIDTNHENDQTKRLVPPRKKAPEGAGS